MLIILFGKSGVGKSYIGELLAKKYNFYFLEADKLLPEALRRAIQNQCVFTQDMRDDFHKVLIEETLKLRKKYRHIIIASAFYRVKNRKELQDKIPDADFIWIKGNNRTILERLKKRGGCVNIHYANKISVYFEEPQKGHQTIINDHDGNEAILEQFLHFLDHKQINHYSSPRPRL